MGTERGGCGSHWDSLCPCSSAEGVGLQSGASTFLTSKGMEVQSPPG